MDRINNVNLHTFGDPKSAVIDRDHEEGITPGFAAIESFHAFMYTHSESDDGRRDRKEGRVSCFLDYIALWMAEDDAIKYISSYEEYFRVVLGIIEVGRFFDYTEYYYGNFYVTGEDRDTGRITLQLEGTSGLGFHLLNWGPNPVCLERPKEDEPWKDCWMTGDSGPHVPHYVSDKRHIYGVNTGDDLGPLSPLRFVEGYGLSHKALSHKFLKKCRKAYKKRMEAEQEAELRKSEEQSQPESTVAE